MISQMNKLQPHRAPPSTKPQSPWPMSTKYDSSSLSQLTGTPPRNKASSILCWLLLKLSRRKRKEMQLKSCFSFTHLSPAFRRLLIRPQNASAIRRAYPLISVLGPKLDRVDDGLVRELLWADPGSDRVGNISPDRNLPPDDPSLTLGIFGSMTYMQYLRA
jgi:hypothetical protein